jgi:hypothetical protein
LIKDFAPLQEGGLGRFDSIRLFRFRMFYLKKILKPETIDFFILDRLRFIPAITPTSLPLKGEVLFFTPFVDDAFSVRKGGWGDSFIASYCGI